MKRETNNLRYRLYIRKSTDSEDRQVQSLADQERIMKDLADKEGLAIVDGIISESKSAKRPYKRPGFERLLSEIEDGNIDGIICWKLDRLSRNPTDSGRLHQLLQDGKLKHIQTIEKGYFPEDNALIFSVEAGMSNQYIRELSTNTKRGMESKAKNGGKNGIPPVGYLNDVVNKTIIKDPEQFDLVRILWDKMLTGTYSLAEITRVAKSELGITIPKRHKTGGKAPSYSSICAMFRNDFYRGKVRYNGMLYDGSHSPMVTNEEFDRVQRIIDPRHASRPQYTMQDFQLKNLLRCGECGYAITAERKQKTLKTTGQCVSYIYYHCTGKSKAIHCSQPKKHVTEEALLSQLRERLSSFTIHPDFYELAKRALAEEEDENNVQQQVNPQSTPECLRKAKRSY